ncbi:hypothetical protein VR7878_01745 [Vibrio ruber DSM 16370]|uniref:GlyGly-CTERM sorting domain-containing protein n=1 Tax=Vibrio ruber (strain DSM 16370 / JCM 11486 / BCRC 17186 / CECT 7878 / LMG 23124 / VR1) TaxID=1123498 RepID=A0A1R4LIK6_VIBR1|nr:DUF3466 family protein [Vibrio ruber]SJN56380.1 hypothetical protein VR7878_01745 [Vibrio ruber DSM 16370]
MTPIKTNISLLAFSVFAATQAHAALYQVVEVTPPVSSGSFQSAFGVAIQPSTDDSSSATNFNSCFLASSIGGTACSDFTLAGETRIQKTMAGQAVDGMSYREEAPFGMDNAFSYAQTENDMKNYCASELLYSTCDAWGEVHWAEWQRELSGDITVNAMAFVEGSPSIVDGINFNIVINSLTTDSKPVGIRSSTGDNRQTVEAQVPASLKPIKNGFDKSRAWKTDGTFTVGSVSDNRTNTFGNYYSSNAAIWGSDGVVVKIGWGSGVSQEKDQRLAQGSIRDFVVKSGTIYGVGYNTYDRDNNFMNATVFKVASSDYATASNWTPTEINNAKTKSGSDRIYSNTVLTAVNDNLVAIGEAKRAGSRPSGGAAANRFFVVPDVSAASPSAQFISDNISFSGAGGHANAINNFNEIVGQVDTESNRESSGKPRRKRAFIYPYNTAGSNATRMGIFANRAWLLDDLTNGGNFSANNNQYRILNASDINDAGVIAATAIKCSGGYDSTAHNATCGNGGQTETTVAVKLIPIENATSSDISPRGLESNAAKRSGGALGSAGLTLLTLLLFRRKW